MGSFPESFTSCFFPGALCHHCGGGEFEGTFYLPYTSFIVFFFRPLGEDGGFECLSLPILCTTSSFLVLPSTRGEG